MGGHDSLHLLFINGNSSNFKYHMVKFLDRSKQFKNLQTRILYSYICTSFFRPGLFNHVRKAISAFNFFF